MSVESTLRVSNRPEIPARLPVAVALLWLAALATSALPWLDQLHLSQILAAFWTFDGNQYASVLAHFSWAPRVSIAVLIGCALRSEEHTSELQSRENLVCRLLLEKKK